MSRVRTRRARGQGVVAVFAAAALIAAGVALDRIPPHASASARGGTAPSGAWYCPHGGGQDWKAWVNVANPGNSPATVRITSFGADAPPPPTELSIKPGASRSVAVPAADRGASTMVEYFGGFVAAGWVVQAGGGETGVGAEPCLHDAGRSFLLPDGTTERGEDSYVVVMNPFGENAVFSLRLFSRQAPVQTSDITTVVLKPRRAIAFHLNDLLLGEPAVGVELTASLGRVAAATLGVSKAGGIWSTDGLGAATRESILPGGQDDGRSVVNVLNAGRGQVTLSGRLLGSGNVQTATGVQGQTVHPQSSSSLMADTGVASTLDLTASAPIAASRRSGGVGGDVGSTAGIGAAAADWVALPTTTQKPFDTRVVVSNLGASDAHVTLTLMGADGLLSNPTPLQMTVPAGRTQIASPDFTNSAPLASVLVRSSGAPIGVTTASYSADRAAYAVAAGVPLGG